ncbi:hypothetical protein GEMRC1_013903 [Eukaryota sp. GEM-RC1]
MNASTLKWLAGYSSRGFFVIWLFKLAVESYNQNLITLHEVSEVMMALDLSECESNKVFGILQEVADDKELKLTIALFLQSQVIPRVIKENHDLIEKVHSLEAERSTMVELQEKASVSKVEYDELLKDLNDSKQREQDLATRVKDLEKRLQELPLQDIPTPKFHVPENRLLLLASSGNSLDKLKKLGLPVIMRVNLEDSHNRNIGSKDYHIDPSNQRLRELGLTISDGIIQVPSVSYQKAVPQNSRYGSQSHVTKTFYAVLSTVVLAYINDKPEQCSDCFVQGNPYGCLSFDLLVDLAIKIQSQKFFYWCLDKIASVKRTISGTVHCYSLLCHANCPQIFNKIAVTMYPEQNPTETHLFLIDRYLKDSSVMFNCCVSRLLHLEGEVDLQLLRVYVDLCLERSKNFCGCYQHVAPISEKLCLYQLEKIYPKCSDQFNIQMLMDLVKLAWTHKYFDIISWAVEHCDLQNPRQNSYYHILKLTSELLPYLIRKGETTFHPGLMPMVKEFIKENYSEVEILSFTKKYFGQTLSRNQL